MARRAIYPPCRVLPIHPPRVRYLCWSERYCDSQRILRNAVTCACCVVRGGLRWSSAILTMNGGAGSFRGVRFFRSPGRIAGA
jgi:hypothetical protein